MKRFLLLPILFVLLAASSQGPPPPARPQEFRVLGLDDVLHGVHQRLQSEGITLAEDAPKLDPGAASEVLAAKMRGCEGVVLAELLGELGAEGWAWAGTWTVPPGLRVNLGALEYRLQPGTLIVLQRAAEDPAVARAEAARKQRAAEDLKRFRR